MLKELDDAMPQHEVASRLGYDPSNITALAGALEAKGSESSLPGKLSVLADANGRQVLFPCTRS